MNPTHQLVLYKFDACPFCQKVLQYMAQKGIDIPTKDTMENPAYQNELVTIGGKAQVPCLVIDGQPLYESDDIIGWFEENWG